VVKADKAVDGDNAGVVESDVAVVKWGGHRE